MGELDKSPQTLMLPTEKGATVTSPAKAEWSYHPRLVRLSPRLSTAPIVAICWPLIEALAALVIWRLFPAKLITIVPAAVMTISEG